MEKRIIGVDVARALAIFGMIIVNFKMVFGSHGSSELHSFLDILDGKAASTFVVLAGVGIALISKRAIEKNDLQKINENKNRLFKRAIFLFFAGFSYLTIWPADILHFYGIYILLTIILLRSSQNVLLGTALGLICLYPITMMIWNYDIGWDYEKMEYVGLWTYKGFIRNLFFNGFHPVIPWSAFVIIGMWFGRMDLNNNVIIKKVLWRSLFIFIGVQLLSYSSIEIFSAGNQEIKEGLIPIFGTSPMPPLPLYMISGSSIAIFIISSCIVLSEKFENTIMIHVLKNTGQLALTIYIAHVVVGIGIVELINPEKMGLFTIHFSLYYALFFIIMCVVFSIFIKKHVKHGPIEWIMRKLTE